jgi:radical SAM family RiPP maturation amino acid epimerase
MSSTKEAYRQIFDEYSHDELYKLARIKRFMERLISDPKFRQMLTDNMQNPRVVTEYYGIDIDPTQMLPLFSTEYLKYRETDEEAQWPLSKMWTGYMHKMLAHRDKLRDHGSTDIVNPSFHAWRQRQITRGISELGVSGPNITHPIVAYELSDGCSVGCWFCGISAEKFEGYQPYTPEVAVLWRGILQEMVVRFGDAAQTGFCYWATDPMDNPDYDKFIEDHYHVTGFLPQTTSAAPLKNVALTRRVMALFDKYRCVTNRFSILNLKLFEKVHAEFTPDELMGVELVSQNREALMSKANAGRARERREKLRAAGKDDKIAERDDDHATIACVSGFLINLPSRTVRMVSPTRGGERWSLGYRVYDERRFETIEDFRAILDEMHERHCTNELQPGDRLAFRPDLKYTQFDDGFEVRNNTRIHTVRGLPYGAHLGRLVNEGDMPVGQIQAELIADGANVFMVCETLQHLFDVGLFDDDPKYGGIGPRPVLLETEIIDSAAVAANELGRA